MSVEGGFRSREDGNGIWTGANGADEVDAPIDQEPGPEETQFRGRDINSRSSSYLAVQDVRQLPSPSPTPSPRSSSPSLVATDNSGELTATLSSIPKKYSGSFEKVAGLVSGSGLNDEGAISSPLPISKTLPGHELHDIPEEKVRKSRRSSNSKTNGDDKVLKLSPAEMQELTSAPESLPMASPRRPSQPSLEPAPALLERQRSTSDGFRSASDDQKTEGQQRKLSGIEPLKINSNLDRLRNSEATPGSGTSKRPNFSTRGISTPNVASNRMSSYKGSSGMPSPMRKPVAGGSRPEALDLNSARPPSASGKTAGQDPPSPIPQSIPLPPMSIPTYLQLELSSSRPSPLYIYRPPSSDFPYESTKVKFERLLNFLILPPQLEQVLYFGSLACLDAWLYTFTILPLRFFKAFAILLQWWVHVLVKEIQFIGGFIYHGAGRMWNRQRERRGSTSSGSRSRSVSRPRRPQVSTTTSYQSQSARPADTPIGNGDLKSAIERNSRQGWGRRHRRTKSLPSSLSSNHKADLLQGAVIVVSCMILLKLDASRMYHSIRGQAAIKLYVIYNLLEVRLLLTLNNMC